MLPGWLSPWVRDLADVTLTVLVVIVVLKVLFRADMLVPLVVVTSDSMVHTPGDNDWHSWMVDHGLTEEMISSFPMKSGFNMGDMILVKNPRAELGDIIIYERDLDHRHFSSNDPIIHRVVGVVHVEGYEIGAVEGTLDCMNDQSMMRYVDMVRACQDKNGECPYTRYPKDGMFKLFITKGDNNEGSDQCSSRLKIAYPVNDAQVTGRALVRLPYVGWLKLILNFVLSIPLLIFKILTFQV
ncbi:MAG: hypothetical protein GF416_03640 [Candidatus Altiarchaeales archaeon]|nr:hypothetical protein [Candidatus Altiarchaeales archaeon]MBD3416212.1 hypothetical protein [Candidatus Altiarchaeales archaeon]